MRSRCWERRTCESTLDGGQWTLRQEGTEIDAYRSVNLGLSSHGDDSDKPGVSAEAAERLK
ncbi:hypothetical protein M378DRAFT_585815 [Amanita muscaria Koide BX008]|uniref:Uncharacterized protein n=1 Tax=Amanita muscaria (strain Koide BX008) TaxID=946122 RepID=A0A0C2TC62_AMAMK|nr:hypothetical protein M378DRAFT_585815 [Amanita muscaria Koide BX008]